MTRAAPARLLGLADRGHLGAGARADVAVYRRSSDMAADVPLGRLSSRTAISSCATARSTHYRGPGAQVSRPSSTTAIDRRLADYYDDAFGLPPRFVRVPEDAHRAAATRSGGRMRS